jgi:glycosyltransferase involved in cell wall biosynthesis
MAAAFRRLLRDDGLRHELQKRAREGSEYFSCSRMTDDVEEVYQELLSKTA